MASSTAALTSTLPQIERHNAFTQIYRRIKFYEAQEE
jgi:hypothetical protein